MRETFFFSCSLLLQKQRKRTLVSYLSNEKGVRSVVQVVRGPAELLLTRVVNDDIHHANPFLVRASSTLGKSHLSGALASFVIIWGEEKERELKINKVVPFVGGLPC